MAIVSSIIVSDRPQIDGRRHIHERHTDHVAVAHEVFYTAEAGADVNATMLARVPALEAQLLQQEIDQNLSNIKSGLYIYTTVWVVAADMRAAVRAAYPTMTEQEVGYTAGFLLLLSDAQLTAMFGVSGPDLTALKGRLQARADELQAVLDAVGE